MSILRITTWKIQKLSYLTDRTRYAIKTKHGNVPLRAVVGIADPFNASAEFMLVHEAYRNKSINLGIHWVLSFDIDASITDEIALEIATKVCKFHSTHQHVLGISKLEKTPNKHVHVVTNTISALTGNYIGLSPLELRNWKIFTNNVLKVYGLNPIKIFSYDQTLEL